MLKKRYFVDQVLLFLTGSYHKRHIAVTVLAVLKFGVGAAQSYSS